MKYVCCWYGLNALFSVLDVHKEDDTVGMRMIICFLLLDVHQDNDTYISLFSVLDALQDDDTYVVYARYVLFSVLESHQDNNTSPFSVLESHQDDDTHLLCYVCTLCSVF